MNLKRIADIKVLDDKTRAAARAEKAATFYLLECLHHLDIMRGYLELGFTSLYDYVHHGLEYSEAQSCDRIAAMRLAFRVHTVKEGLRDGALSLTVVSKLATYARQEKIAPEQISELAKTAAHKSVRDVEKLIAATRPNESIPLIREKIRPVTATISKLEIAVDEEFGALLTEARELSHDPTISIAALLKAALKAHVEKKKNEKGANSGAAGHHTVTQLPIRKTPASVIGSPRSIRVNTSQANSVRQYISIQNKRMLWARASGQCEHINPLNKTRCLSRQSLQIDHVNARIFGGTNDLPNLQYLCATHNRAKGSTN